jgi:5'-deoxynucleotidase YfbR-like HD superfamily hydrolase
MSLDFYQTWRSGKVIRMHTMPQLDQENVAAHTWGMLLAIVRFYPQASANFLKAVILHDAGEIATGDIPAHIKWSSPELEAICHQKEHVWIAQAGLYYPDLSEAERLLMLVFDKFDFCMSCIHEMRLGNLNAARYYKRSYSKATEALAGLLLIDHELYEIGDAYSSELDRIRLDYCSHVGDFEYDLSR